MQGFLENDALTVAEKLLGCGLIYEDEKGKRGGLIVETEAYTPDDPASHSYRGKTVRNKAMFEKAGTIYVYKIYGMHLCLNIVTGKKDGQAVLIRALEPTVGIDFMKRQRAIDDIGNLCSGPAKLVQALGLTHHLNGTMLGENGLVLRSSGKASEVVRSRRIGITKAADKDWRFYTHGSKFVSKY